MRKPSLPCVLLLTGSVLAQQGSAPGELPGHLTGAKTPRPWAAATPRKAAPAAEPVLPATDAAATPRVQRVAPVPGADDRSAPPSLRHLGTVVFDAGGADLWASSDDWKARFSAAGVDFLPFLGSDAPHDFPMHFALQDATVGEAAFALTAPKIARDGDTVTLDRGGVRERYVAGTAGIEQQFVFAELPARGALRLELAVDGEFTVHADGAGFRCENAYGAFTYGAAIAVDARGRSVPVHTTWDAQHLVLEVPAAFVAEAALPLVVDPMIGNTVRYLSANTVLRAADVAFDASLDRWVVCWERVYSQTDSDVFLQPAGFDKQPLGSVVPVDISNTSWARCHVAGLNAYDVFLVVAECATPGTPSWVGSRLYHAANGGLDAQTALLQGALPILSPDVGGDPSEQTPTYFTLVYEAEFGPTDHDVHYVQVRGDGTLRGAPAVIDNTLAYEHSPRIAKSDGMGSAASQAWEIVYRRDDNQRATGQTRVACVTWDGHVVQQWFGNTTQLTAMAAPGGANGVAVSSPTDEVRGRIALVVDTALDANGHAFLRGNAVNQHGSVLAFAQELTSPVNPDHEPALDCDGARFAMTFVEAQAWPRLAYGIYDLVGNQVLRPYVGYMTNSLQTDHSGGVVAMHSGGAVNVYQRQFTAAWTTEQLPSGVFAQDLLATGSTAIGIRATGCGPLTVSTQGTGTLGETVHLQLNNSVGYAGWVFGFPVDVALGFCPGCRQGSTAMGTLAGTVQQVAIPLNGALVGVQFAFQGFDFSAGTCLGSLAISDTVDLTVQ